MCEVETEQQERGIPLREMQPLEMDLGRRAKAQLQEQGDGQRKMADASWADRSNQMWWLCGYR